MTEFQISRWFIADKKAEKEDPKQPLEKSQKEANQRFVSPWIVFIFSYFNDVCVEAFAKLLALFFDACIV